MSGGVAFRRRFGSGATPPWRRRAAPGLAAVPAVASRCRTRLGGRPPNAAGQANGPERGGGSRAPGLGPRAVWPGEVIASVAGGTQLEHFYSPEKFLMRDEG